MSSTILKMESDPDTLHQIGMLELLGYDRDLLDTMTLDQLSDLYWSAMDGHDPDDFEGLVEDDF